MKPKILVVDDEMSMRKFFEVTLNREGYDVSSAESVASGQALLKGDEFDLILSDIKLGDGQGLEILAASKDKDSDVPVIMMTAYASPETAVEAMKLGAADYLTKPFNVDEVRVVVANNLRNRGLALENKALKSKIQAGQKTKMIFKSERMKKLTETLERVAKMDTTILVTGESGTGKELVMKTIHEMSPRTKQPFISVNCGALPETLFESELFGYEKGSFTGAEARKQGLFEAAKGGTLFLDEIGELPLKMQIKLLRVLQEKTIRRVGGNEEIPVDFRLVAATNRDLKSEVDEGNFREDLYYRINVVPLHLPALRERRDDIVPLVQHFFKKFTTQCGEAHKQLSTEAVAILDSYNWPGNVRELENTIERIVALTPGDIIEAESLPSYLTNSSETLYEDCHIPQGGMDLEGFLDDVRFRYMRRSLELTGGIQSKSCELLGMSSRSFRYYLSKGKDLGYFE